MAIRKIAVKRTIRTHGSTATVRTVTKVNGNTKSSTKTIHLK